MHFFCPSCILIDLASLLSDFFSAGFPKLNSTFQRIFQGKTFGLRVFFKVSTAFEFEGKTFGLLATAVRQRCQNCTLCVGRTFWGKTFVFTKFYNPKYFRTESDKCSAVLLKLFATFAEQKFYEKGHFLWKNLPSNPFFGFFHIRTVEKISHGSFPKLFRQVSENWILGVQRIFLSKKCLIFRQTFFSFPDVDRGIFERLHKKYLPVCSELHSMYTDIQRNDLKRISWFKN